MNVLLIGGGAREHAIAAALKRSPGLELFAVMKNRNPGIARLCQEVIYGPEDSKKEIPEYARKNNIDFAIVGPEAPLGTGLADALWKAGIPCVGPTKSLARIEVDKAFTRNLLKKYNIASNLEFAHFNNADEACDYMDRIEGDVAIKPVGLTGGKGVKVQGEQLKDKEEAKVYIREIMQDNIGGGEVVIEEKALGEEFTVMAFVDGTNVVPMPAVQDHKRAFEGDKGHNTGGMGSYSVKGGLLPFIVKEDYDFAVEVMRLTVDALKKETGEEYKGILYGQFIKGKDIKLIEYNCRFGDPEAMNALTLLDSDFSRICQSIVKGTLKKEHVIFKDMASVCKYVVPVGYGTKSLSGNLIQVDEAKIEGLGATVYYAAVNEEAGKIFSTSSRSLGVVALDESVENAERTVEKALEYVKGDNIYHRKDIGTEELIMKKVNSLKLLRKTL